MCSVRVMGVAWVVAALGLLTSSAAAEPRVLRIARATTLSGSAREAPSRITEALAAAVGGTISDELTALHCDENEACLAQLADQLEASELIFGTIRSGGNRDTRL